MRHKTSLSHVSSPGSAKLENPHQHRGCEFLGVQHYELNVCEFVMNNGSQCGNPLEKFAKTQPCASLTFSPLEAIARAHDSDLMVGFCAYLHQTILEFLFCYLYEEFDMFFSFKSLSVLSHLKQRSGSVFTTDSHNRIVALAELLPGLRRALCLGCSCPIRFLSQVSVSGHSVMAGHSSCCIYCNTKSDCFSDL